MAQPAALRRLRKEYASLRRTEDPLPGATIRPDESNLLHAHFLLYGDVFHDTCYEGGVYHGVLRLPSHYPLQPPSVQMITPSGRFVPHQKICFSMSDFHPELWNPMWNLRSIVMALTSFMNSDEGTTGSLQASHKDRVAWAKASLDHCLTQDSVAMTLFGPELRHVRDTRRESPQETVWPPPRRFAMDSAGTTADANPSGNDTASCGTASRPTARSRATTSASSSLSSSPGPTKQQGGDDSPTTNSNHNAARNKKKRDREKRRKLVRSFLATLNEQVPVFVTAVHTYLSTHTSILDRGDDHNDHRPHRLAVGRPDHVCWRTESLDEYNALVRALTTAGPETATRLIESDIGGRPIATVRLTRGIPVTLGGGGDTPVSHTMDVIEIPAPKEGRPYRSGLEHVEFVLSSSLSLSSSEPSWQNDRAILTDFMQRHNNRDAGVLEWSTRALDKKVNPDVSLTVELADFGLCTVKFHTTPLDKVIEYEVRQQQQQQATTAESSSKVS